MKKITFTRDGRKKADVRITKGGSIVFTKENVVVNVEDEDTNGAKLVLAKMKIGNKDADINWEE